MDKLLLVQLIYYILLIAVCIQIVYETNSTAKSLAYLLLVIFIPLLGMIIYFLVGINYRHRKMYSRKLIQNRYAGKRLRAIIRQYSENIFITNNENLDQHKKLAIMAVKDIESPLTGNNAVKVLQNGEEKFPALVNALLEARHHIHIEYYIYEDDEIGRQLENILVKKAQEGVRIRFIYDDFGSNSIRKLVKRLKTAGIQVFPFLKVSFFEFASKLNYRNHRKIIIIDGRTGFVGGINVSDKYINDRNRLYWRDTHLRIDGPGVMYLQYIFLCDWNFCAKESLQPDAYFFPRDLPQKNDNKIVQITASGPDSDTPAILFSLLQAINLATEEILITSPYFIPGESLSNALMMASLSGVKVRLLTAGISDSRIVNAAAKSYFNDLLKAGVEIYLYKKGFVHAKTMITDKRLSIVGTANMDNRSFELNFEVNAIVYDAEVAAQLRHSFYQDINNAEKIDALSWNNRPRSIQLIEKIARLLSPML
ncbi:cardiolipin synthase [Flavihumibacter sp. CACIAM 22H1]|uniref:cardiolipin synthase n=1 Tax=Flavihumibacter sp. CACIAM 22H1 TaxID=1812911 RepID=UPI0007A7C6A4|nr:cardiolipin synthase [Flavihumibacter sp. CACIAM 22H1]KYP13341.1 MAG: cardiolipin synthase [Flavihumibacter sp. CACIAM 22H1]